MRSAVVADCLNQGRERVGLVVAVRRQFPGLACPGALRLDDLDADAIVDSAVYVNGCPLFFFWVQGIHHVS